MQNNLYTTEIIEDPVTGEAIIQFNEGLLKSLDWRENDRLLFSSIEGKGLTITNLSWQGRNTK